jgi:hypothetical protein
MASHLFEGDSLLAVDVGAATTRAVLFDVVEGRYRFIAAGRATTTAEAPLNDIGESVRQAIEHLQFLTGKTFLDEERRLISPMQADGSGVDAFVATLSAGAPLNAIIIGLLEDVSLKSARHLAESTYVHIADAIGLNDRRPAQEKLDNILHARPALIVIAGGTNHGATHSLQKLIEPVGLACYLLPKETRPAILFAGNQTMQQETRDSLEAYASAFRTAPNIRPSIEVEDLEPAKKALARLFVEIRKRELKSVDELDMWTGGHLLPSAFAEGRIARFLGRLYGEENPILFVNLGMSAASLHASFGSETISTVYPQFGLGETLTELLRYTSLEKIERWLPIDTEKLTLQAYLHQKSLYPMSIPATKEDLYLEQAIAREALRLALQTAKPRYPAYSTGKDASLTPPFERIFAGGSVLANAPTLGQSLLMLLDSIQPTGITTIILDTNHLMPLLGAASDKTSILPIQVLDSGAFTPLATVVSPVSSARYGTPILKAHLIRKDGVERKAELKQGGFEVLQLPEGQSARLILQPSRRTDIGAGAGRHLSRKVTGSAIGIVLDGRGRPLTLTEDPVRRREFLKKWHWTVGG